MVTPDAVAPSRHARGEAKAGAEKMTTLKTLAIAVAFVGSTSLAFAQGPGIAPDSSVLPPQTNTPGGVAASPASPNQSPQVKRSHRLYNMSTPKKKHHHMTPSK
jgi:hypothetical protein